MIEDEYPDAPPAIDDMRRALAVYTDEPGVATDADFIPTRLLYADYRSGFLLLHPIPDANQRPPLNLIDFGVMIRQVFPRAARRRREYERRLCWGYAHVCGPRSIRTAPPICGKPRACDKHTTA